MRNAALEVVTPAVLAKVGSPSASLAVVALGKELTYGMDDLFTGPFEIKYIPDSGHWVQQEKPELVNQYMRDFLAPLLDASTSDSAASPPLT